MKFYSQAGQDQYILKCLNNKRNGYFLEIGSHDPISINNTYVLEKEFGWKGILVEYDSKYLNSYIEHRPNSYPIIEDATLVDYRAELEKNNFPKNMDYLQIDLEADNGSTLKTLQNLESQVMSDYKFAVVTFEHDYYTGNHFNTREISRQIFDRNGYFRVFTDVMINGNCPFEDWYVHPDLVDMEYINKIKKDEPIDWFYILRHINSIY